jgi:hypothetical protein
MGYFKDECKRQKERGENLLGFKIGAILQEFLIDHTEGMNEESKWGEIAVMNAHKNIRKLIREENVIRTQHKTV